MFGYLFDVFLLGINAWCYVDDKRRWWSLIGMLIGASLVTADVIDMRKAHAQDIPTMRQSVVEVSNTNGLGSGVVISGTEVLTAAHVIDDADHVSIQFWNVPMEIVGHVQWMDKDKDIALIRVKVPDSIIKSLINCKLPEYGSDLISIGFPLGMPWVLTKGYVAGEYDDNMMLMDVRTNHGNSGGPVFNNKGEVIGITLAEVGQLPDKKRGIGNTFGVFRPTFNFCKEIGRG